MLNLAILIPALIAADCHSEEIIATDTAGKTITAPVSSLVCLYGAFNDILIALGAQDRIAARTDADADNPAISHLPVIGTHMRPDPEKIIEASPSLVIGLKGRQDAIQALQALNDFGIPVIFLELDSFEQLFEATRLLGRLTGRGEKATELINGWQERLKTLAAKRQEARPKVFYEARYPNLLAAGKKGIINDIISAAGGINAVRENRKLVRLNEEWLLDADPDLYIIQQGPMNPAPVPLEERSAYSGLQAARNYLTVPEKEFARPGPNSIKAAEWLAARIDELKKEQK